jgi:hypothetical protein
MMRLDRWRALTLAGLALRAAACSKLEHESACARDRDAVSALLAEEQGVVALLHEADGLASKGQGAAAADRIERAARAQSERVIARVEQFQPASRWGVEARHDLHNLARERRVAMDAYARALRSDALEVVVREMEAQRTLEALALALQQRLAKPPDASKGECAPP